MGPKYSVSEFVKAMATADSHAEQARAMEQINVDVVDMVNQIRAFAAAEDEAGSVPHVQLKTVDDVKFVVARAAMSLRVWVERKVEADEEAEADLNRQIAALEDKLGGLEDEKYELEQEIRELEERADRLEDKLDRGTPRRRDEP